MGKELTDTGRTIASTLSEDNTLDACIKDLFSCKQIFARILLETVEECKGMTLEEVIGCIGELSHNEYVNPNDAMIEKLDTEDSSLTDGLIQFDIVSALCFPNEKKSFLAKIIIDMEGQKDDTPGYDISERGIYYCCRLISRQHGVEFTTKTEDPLKYRNIKKVYSIWICPRTAQKRANTIEKYHIAKEMLYGKDTGNSRFDLFTVIIVNINSKTNYKKEGNVLIKMLSDLFNDEMEAAEKLQKLEEEYRIPITEDVRREVQKMSSYTASIIAEATEKGMEEAENRYSALMQKLFNAGRMADARKAAEDEEARKAFYREFGLID